MGIFFKGWSGFYKSCTCAISGLRGVAETCFDRNVKSHRILYAMLAFPDLMNRNSFPSQCRPAICFLGGNRAPPQSRVQSPKS